MSVEDRPHGLAPFIDHSCLRPNATAADVDRACAEAVEHGFRGVVVPGRAVAQARRRLADTGVKVVAVVGFPHGTSAVDVKAFEATRASADGADEIDYVIAVDAAARGDLSAVRDECAAILRAAPGRRVKAILEIGFLDERRRVDTARALAESGVHFVKTCTGFGPGACTEEDVKLLVRAVAGKALVKASGGVKDRSQALAMLRAGAAVIGTSNGPAICG
jgi:deoxyribose-phosphate aldolase